MSHTFHIQFSINKCSIYIAATKFAWTKMFNGSKAREPVTNGMARQCIKYFGGQRGVWANPLEPPCLWFCNEREYTCPYVCMHLSGLGHSQLGTNSLGKILMTNSPPFYNICHRYARWGIPLTVAFNFTWLWWLVPTRRREKVALRHIRNRSGCARVLYV